MFTLQRKNEFLLFRDGEKQIRVAFVSASIARVTYTENRVFSDAPSHITTTSASFFDYRITERDDDFLIVTHALQLEVAKVSGAIRYRDNLGQVLLQEPDHGGKWLTPTKVFRNVYDPQKRASSGQSIDGARAAADDFTSVFDRNAFEAKIQFEFAVGEALFGLGSHEEGNGNLRGKYVQLYQQNMKAVVPHLVSTKGYGILLDCGSLMTFHDDAHGSFFWAEAVDQLDYYFIFGGNFSGVTRGYYELTG